MPHTAGHATAWTSHPTLARAAKGHFTLDNHRTGIFIHTTNTVESETVDVALPRHHCLTLGVLLKGEMEFTLKGKRHHLRVPDQNTCVLFSLVTADHEQLIRHTRQHRRVCKVLLSVDSHWIHQQSRYDPELGRRLQAHLDRGHHCDHAIGTLAPAELAEKLLHPAPASPVLQQLQAEYHGMELLRTMLSELEASHSQLAMERARLFIERHLNQAPSLSHIARHTGLSISTLQRSFKTHYGRTVMHYIRERKLQHARASLQANRISIGEAAYQAGYKHTSNFVTAYKKAFGITPGTEEQS